MVFCENKKLDCKFEDVADLLPGKEIGAIKVRVLRLWKVPAFMNPMEFNSLEMVLCDGKGGKIHASVRKQLINMFDSKLEEGGVYEISSLSIFPESGLYRTTLHRYKLGFQSKTVVKPSQSSDISQYGFSFTNIDEICSFTHDYEFLVDVVGVMTGISAEREYIRDGKITKMVNIELTDHTGKCECALFGDYVDDLNKKMGKLTSGLPIVAVQFAKVKMFRDKASIQNVLHATRIFVNADIPELESFKSSIAVHGIESDTIVPLIGSQPRPSLEEEFLQMHPKKTVAQLNVLVEDGVFAVCGEVVGVVDSQNWWYPACKCHKAVVPDSGSYFCSSCDRHVFQVIPRFRVKFEIVDGESSCIVVVFDSEMSYILEKSCAFFVAQSKARNGGPHPIEFDGLIGKKMLFAVAVSGKQSSMGDGSYRVRRICMDPVIIEKFCSQGGFCTPTKVMSPVVDFESESLSDDNVADDDSEALQFVDNLIVTPPTSSVDIDDESDGPFVVKRNLSKAFDGAAKPKRSIRLKKVKIEKD
ncbi:replication factor-A carboxy-terminal domain protein [Trifolium pratense]|uniref:Replication factor-A carboxy-terminal domain protein n=1 Tax=Trifolium pratense TaxID=57577 RepID=A0A2K3N059_TRIPR|nr:replication factor A protein 1-like [Trifolium pratense]XP_045825142.1 replication factor A protein 1-like [Trifolium pratense]PNX96435.1 replication factor-A carboxy-terminal domain protein [Trifolium pratense]